MLTRLRVNNFRCMANFECEFGGQQIVLGANGSGKSTLFDVLMLVRDFCGHGVSADDQFGGRTRTRWQDVPDQSIEMEVAGRGGVYRLTLRLDSYGTPRRSRVLTEEVLFDGKPVFRFEKGEVHLYNDKFEEKVNYPFDWHRSALATIAERTENTILTWFKRWLGGLLLVSPDPRRMSGVAGQESPAPDQYLANFADWYRHLRQETHADPAYQKDLGAVIPGFTSMTLERAGEGRREIVVRMEGTDGQASSKDPPAYFLDEMSEGQRVLIGLYAVLNFGLGPGMTVCFDEPDNFIALREIHPWLSRVLERLDDEKAAPQVLIASHHPELLNRMAFKEGILLERPTGRDTIARKFGDPARTGLSASELVARGWEVG